MSSLVWSSGSGWPAAGPKSRPTFSNENVRLNFFAVVRHWGECIRKLRPDFVGAGVGSADAQMHYVYASVHILTLSVPAPILAQTSFSPPLAYPSTVVSCPGDRSEGAAASRACRGAVPRHFACGGQSSSPTAHLGAFPAKREQHQTPPGKCS